MSRLSRFFWETLAPPSYSAGRHDVQKRVLHILVSSTLFLLLLTRGQSSALATPSLLEHLSRNLKVQLRHEKRK